MAPELRAPQLNDSSNMLVSYETAARIAHIRLQRPDAMNAMNRQMYAEVNSAFRKFNADADAAVCVFSSGNAEAFCAGVDIKDVHKAIAEEKLSLEVLGKEMDVFFEAPGQLSKPVIAAIHGHCVGEGMVMTLFCDMRIAASNAMFALPEAKIGVPSINGTIRAIQLAGHGPAMELLLTGEARDADWAMANRLVNRVVAPDELMATAVALAKSIASNDADAIRIMRQLGDKALEEKFPDLVALGVNLRASIKTENMVGRQQDFKDRKRAD